MITNKLLFGIVLGFVAVEVAILVVWTIVSPLRFNKIPDANRNVLQDYEVCSSEYGLVFFGIFLAYKGVLLVIGIFLSIVTRNVDSDFRESKYIGFSIYAVFFTMLIVLIVLFVVGLNPVVRFVLTCLGVWIVTVSVYLLLYIPKLVAIVREPDNLWRGYFARRAQEITNNFGRSRPVSGFGGSYVSSFGDSSSDMQEAVSDMNRQQKKAYLELVERNWEFLVVQKRNIEKCTFSLDFASFFRPCPHGYSAITVVNGLRRSLKLPPRSWDEDAVSIETPRTDGDGRSFATRTTTTPMSTESVHSVIVREDGSHVTGGLRPAPKMNMDMYDSDASDTGDDVTSEDSSDSSESS